MDQKHNTFYVNHNKFQNVPPAKFLIPFPSPDWDKFSFFVVSLKKLFLVLSLKKMEKATKLPPLRFFKIHFCSSPSNFPKLSHRS